MGLCEYFTTHWEMHTLWLFIQAVFTISTIQCYKLGAISGVVNVFTCRASDADITDITEKPWRAPKQKLLTYVYRPNSESWKENSIMKDSDTVVIYTSPEWKTNFDSTGVNDLWDWPWMWSKTKAERLSWLHKQLDNNLGNMTVQEHIEMDSLYSEFDMPFRWGLLRLKEMDVLNVMALWIAFLFAFKGTEPTDLGIRTDGTLRACPVQFHNCISSSNSPADTDHFAPHMRWSASKSPDQAYEEVKAAYLKYPKRGLKWSSGWIDRGGWRPQSYSGPYFYAQADSLALHFTDDVELLVDPVHRQVQYRSSGRLGQVDFDTQRMRYNQFVRMLQKQGGWEVAPLPRLRYASTAPWRWTQQLLERVVVMVPAVRMPPAVADRFTAIASAVQPTVSMWAGLWESYRHQLQRGSGADTVMSAQPPSETTVQSEAPILVDNVSDLRLGETSAGAREAEARVADGEERVETDYHLTMKLSRDEFRRTYQYSGL